MPVSTPVAKVEPQRNVPPPSNSLLIPIYSIEDAKAAKQQVITIHNAAKSLSCSSVTFELLRSNAAEIQAELGVFSSSLKLYYVFRDEQPNYVLFRLPHFMTAQLKAPQPLRSPTPQAHRESEEPVKATSIAPSRRFQKNKAVDTSGYGE
jgi:hypothetical protein